MVTLLYDGSFEGWLTAVFDIYACKLQDVQFAREAAGNASRYYHLQRVHTSRDKAKRVWNALVQRNSTGAAQALYHTFLAEQRGVEQTLLRYVQHAFRQNKPIETDYGHPSVVNVIQTARKVRREINRLEALTRFQQAGDGLHYAIIEPAYNLLPLLSRQLEKRYAGEHWLLYDGKRKYGRYYRAKQSFTVQLIFSAKTNLPGIHKMYDADETLYQQLWQRYSGRAGTKLKLLMVAG